MYSQLPVANSIFFIECGGAPNVTLSCYSNNGSALVDWVASIPGCQYDCKATWTCRNHTNTTDPHEDVVSSWLFSMFMHVKL